LDVCYHWNRDHAKLLVRSILSTAGQGPCLRPEILGVKLEVPHKQYEEPRPNLTLKFSGEIKDSAAVQSPDPRMLVSRQSKGSATVGKTTTSQGVRQAESLGCTGPSLTRGAASPPQTVYLLAMTNKFQTPPASTVFGLSPFVDAGMQDKGRVNRKSECIPVRHVLDSVKSQESKRPLIRVAPSQSCQFECTGFRDPVAAWGVAGHDKPKALSSHSVAPSVKIFQSGGLNTCIEVGSLGINHR
jgi:hypothetical protein